MKKSLFKKVFTSAVAFGIAATAFSTQSFAATDATVSGGSLTGGGVSFTPLSAQLDGTQVSTNTTWAIADIVDARGNGEGWNLSMTLDQFKEYDTVAQGYVTNGKVLATSSLKVKTAPVVAQKDLTSSSADTITPVTVGQALDGAGSVKLLSAAFDGGMGSYTVSGLGVELTIPANAYAKTYKTEATVSLTTAP